MGGERVRGRGKKLCVILDTAVSRLYQINSPFTKTEHAISSVRNHLFTHICGY